MKIIYLALFILVGCASKAKEETKPVTPEDDKVYEVIECYPGPLK